MKLVHRIVSHDILDFMVYQYKTCWGLWDRFELTTVDKSKAEFPMQNLLISSVWGNANCTNLDSILFQEWNFELNLFDKPDLVIMTWCLASFLCRPFLSPFHAPTRGPHRPERYTLREEGEGRAWWREETPRWGNRKWGGRCNTRSTFEASRCNTGNIRLNAYKTLETGIWNTCKNT